MYGKTQDSKSQKKETQDNNQNCVTKATSNGDKLIENKPKSTNRPARRQADNRTNLKKPQNRSQTNTSRSRQNKKNPNHELSKATKKRTVDDWRITVDTVRRPRKRRNNLKFADDETDQHKCYQDTLDRNSVFNSLFKTNCEQSRRNNELSCT